ncbi:MAG: acetyl-CoA carboxylase carboxyl transferase subunit alpha, partial [Chlamydiia bacterium]|nr:acetyl-CoA carboxylase carboxyl transferase subunit alpha [Chlamydiia bacterium]
ILWKDTGKTGEAAAALKMHVEDLLKLGIIDEMIPEPLGGAHLNPQLAFRNVAAFIQQQWKHLQTVPTELLLENRYQKFRKMGKFVVHEATL